MMQAPIAPLVLIILDGWGYRQETDGNAIRAAKTPIMDSLLHVYPQTLLQASGKAVGLPEGQMGNSEVGHLNIGTGRVVPQELVRISDAIEDGSIRQNPALMQVCQDVCQRQSRLHLIGLCSEGGVHSHLDHLIGLIEMAKAEQVPDVCIHMIMDGRDTLPTEGQAVVEKLQAALDRIGVGRIVTVSGRYYSMDRDRRWERTQRAYEVMTQEGEIDGRSPLDIVRDAYAAGVTDEFIEPVRVAPGAIAPGDGVIFFNFRPDRARQLTSALTVPDFDGFERELIQPLSFVTLTQYDPSLPVAVAFEPQNLSNILGEVLANHHLRQLRTAETEKYAHVTYFFNGGLEEPFEGEDRKLVMSPMVSTYDQAPAMSAEPVTDGVIAAIDQGIYSLIVVNYANPDMVGHTGNYEAAIQAIETVDRCVGRVLERVSQASGTVLITADHGNAELMWDEQGNPWTAHTTNLVPFILVEGEKLKIAGHGAKVELRSDGKLCDIAPTILEILRLPQPPEMTGRSLLVKSPLEVCFREGDRPLEVLSDGQSARTPVPASL
ncbi:2,3-bisphosphoglycerate-independent phosphoglycerate mutase [Trichothermofontia sp.]